MAGSRNRAFLAQVDGKTKSEIIESIAKHYVVSQEETLAEVCADEAQELLDYMVEPMRSVTMLLMRRHGFWPPKE